ncbi:HEAT repeat domain-containing protein [Zavarzinella formosa]|uniref:HEAT repeat domain-containing protein n=1 Tax=Zavarzinella formosa TaxID=360055 RepID=UPI00031CD180|nr:HEAT repeat domain-containing protein [Zavarzinella formosa]
MQNWLRRMLAPARRETRPELLVRANSLDAETRRGAVDGLALSAEPWAGPALVNLLGDSHSVVREAANAAFRQLGSNASPILQKGLEHAVPEVAKTSAELLGELGTSEAVGPLLLALKYGPRPVQLAARRSLIKLGEASVPALELAQGETHPWVKQQIDEILAATQRTARMK